MAQALLVFDFRKNEEAAQQARHRIDGWKQGFRLGNKLQFKFERTSSDSAKDARTKVNESSADTRVRLFVRLDFSNHEKHLFQTWIKRIPSEEPFKSAESEIVRANEDGFEKTNNLYESLA
ncbi:MAG TPA: hypothetical protein VGR81_12465 [Candidatus Acidoferrales bacterium]|nr:hypothetical protein [Candidatus Acidoferrales bacterium]